MDEAIASSASIVATAMVPEGINKRPSPPGYGPGLIQLLDSEI